MTRGALTTFSIANDIAKYFAIIPAMFLAFYPQLCARSNIMGLAERPWRHQRHPVSDHLQRAGYSVALIPLVAEGRHLPRPLRPPVQLLSRNLADLWPRRRHSCRSSASRSIDMAISLPLALL